MASVQSGGLIATSQRDLAAFDLIRPRTLAEAVVAMSDSGMIPTLYAGGTDLCAKIRTGLQIEKLVWLKHVAELRLIEISSKRLDIGALVTHAVGAPHSAVAQIPGLAEAWRKIANVRIRRSATIGGNLMACQPRYEMSILMMALDASLRFATPEGAMELSAPDIWQGRAPLRGILERVSISLQGAPRLDYERSFRPVFTSALVVRGGDGQPWSAKAVIATEYLQPVALPLDLVGVASIADLQRGAADLAAAAFEGLPDDFEDSATSQAYLKQAGAVVLRRQLSKMGQPHVVT